MQGAIKYCAYYRSNPHRFVKDYLHIDLRLFQKILLCMMFWCTQFVFIASRGLGKTFLSSIYCVVRCILYPGTKICVASGTRGQAYLVIEKIMMELKPRSKELACEIDDKETKLNGTNQQIVFKNSSYIKVVTAGDSARGNRANVLLIDEARLVNKDAIDTILKQFLTLTRMPPYRDLSDEQRNEEYRKETNIIIWLSSAYFADHWLFTKCQDTVKAMLNDSKHQFICGLPYQLSIKEGLLNEEMILDEVSETGFSSAKFSMEYEALWWGNTDGAFFDFKDVSKNRKITHPMLPDNLSSVLGDNSLKIPPKQNGEYRILSADIALMSSKKHNNDATAIFINQMLPTKVGRYTKNIVYTCTNEGLRTEAQSLIIRQLFDQFACDYIALDCNGLGIGIYDCLSRDITDPETGEIYPALSCCNDSEMAARCTSPDAPKVIWSLKANAQFNSDCAFTLREDLRSGRIRLLVSEYDGENYINSLKGASNLSDSVKVKLLLPYIHTTLLIEELVNLQHEENLGKVRIYEKSGMRKDRFSSLMYNNYVATQIEMKTNKHNARNSADDIFAIRAPSYKGKAVSSYGRRGKAL